MAQSGAYKKLNRNERSMILEESFGKGMCSDNIPLAEGMFKTLVNYQITEGGRQLIPRKGLSINRIGPSVVSIYPWLTSMTYFSQHALYYNTLYKFNRKTGSNPIQTKLILMHPGTSYATDEVNLAGEYKTHSSGNLQYYGFVNTLEGWTDGLVNGTESLTNYSMVATQPPVQQTGIGLVDTAMEDCGQCIRYLGNFKGGLKVNSTLPTFSAPSKLLCTTLNDNTYAMGYYYHCYPCTHTPNGDGTYTCDRTVPVSLQGRAIRIDTTDNITPFYEFVPIDGIMQLDVAKNLRDYSKTSNNDYLAQINCMFLNTVNAREINPNYAASYGYNMLSPTPYTFTCNKMAAYELTGLIPYADKSCTTLKLSYDTNEQLYFKVYYNYDANTEARIEIDISTDGTTTWNELKYEVMDLTKNNIVLPLCAPPETFYLKCTITTADSEDVLSSNTYSFSGANDYSNASTKGLDPKVYKIGTGFGITTWKHRLVVWGVDDAPDIVFMSDIDNPSYFPYPNGCEVYDAPVLHVLPFLDALLIFTQHAIYKTKLDSKGTLVTETVATDINISAEDTYSIVTIKNMVFYKSNNYYYMLVPSSKVLTLGELNVAPISKPINYFLDHFETELRKIIYNMYSDLLTDDTFTLTPNIYNVYTVGDEVCLDFGFDLVDPKLTTRFSFILKYSVALRTWSTSIIEFSNPIQLYCKNIAGTPQYITFNTTTNGESHTIAPVLLQEDIDNTKDSFYNEMKLHTRQYLDTGFRNMSSGWKKRFREIQLKINNKLMIPLEFKTGFILDNENRVNVSGTTLVPDNTGHLVLHSTAHTMSTILDEVIDDGGIAVLNAANAELGLNARTWTLDTTSLASKETATLRWHITGKGYLPRLQLLSSNEKSYEILGIAWVARSLNAR